MAADKSGDIQKVKDGKKKALGLAINLRLKGGRPIKSTDIFTVDSFGRVLQHITPTEISQPGVSKRDSGWRVIYSTLGVAFCVNPSIRMFRLFLFHRHKMLYRDLNIHEWRELRDSPRGLYSTIFNIGGKKSHFTKKIDLDALTHEKVITRKRKHRTR